MVTCNICGKKKFVAEIESCFRYICKDCWRKAEITIEGIEVNKELMY